VFDSVDQGIMARTKGSNSIDTSRRIVAAAGRLIAVQGFDGLSMRALAAACGLQAGALYHHFADKQALLVHLLEQHFEALQVAFAALPAEFASPAGHLHAFAATHVRFHATNRLSTLLVLHDMRSLDRAGAAPLLKLRHRHEQRLQSILAAGVSAATFRQHDPLLLSRALLAFLSETAIWYRPGGEKTLVAVTSGAADLVCAMVAA
jgi:AcrR family transcriptional regulator